MNLPELIKQHARHLGFALCGITTPEPPPHLAEYEAWIEQGLHGEMHYMGSESARRKRSNPRIVFPECKSILVVAANYYQGELPDELADTNTGKVARYAWGKDYHDVLPERLRQLVNFIEGQVGHTVRHKIYTDTGPLLERELAQRAGLGWIGRNTNLINSNIGSWLLLAEVLLDLYLEPDEPFKVDHCGSCTRCIEECPTDAIMSNPRRLDSRRCISYLTIELKGSLEPQNRQEIGDWIFGCDICQQVCPWNLRFAETQEDSDFAPKDPSPNPDLHKLMNLSEEAYNLNFQGSPIKRAKRQGLLRNVAVSLGNMRSPKALTSLAKALREDHDHLVRAHAAWGLGQLQSAEATKICKDALQSEQHPEVLTEIRKTLRESNIATPTA